MSSKKQDKKLKQYILYLASPIKNIGNPLFFEGHIIDSLKSEITGMYKYRFKILPNTINKVIIPLYTYNDAPFLIICDTNLYGYSTSSTLTRGSKKYIYNPSYPITTKQPYKQLKEHYSQFLANKLTETL